MSLERAVQFAFKKVVENLLLFVPPLSDIGIGLLGVCFLREAPERAIGTDRRAGKWGC